MLQKIKAEWLAEGIRGYFDGVRVEAEGRTRKRCSGRAKNWCEGHRVGTIAVPPGPNRMLLGPELGVRGQSGKSWGPRGKRRPDCAGFRKPQEGARTLF